MERQVSSYYGALPPKMRDVYDGLKTFTKPVIRSISQEKDHVSGEARVKSQLVNPYNWIIADQLAKGSYTLESFAETLGKKDKKRFIDTDPKALGFKLQELQKKGICKQEFPEGQPDGLWSLTSQSQALVRNLSGIQSNI